QGQIIQSYRRMADGCAGQDQRRAQKMFSNNMRRQGVTSVIAMLFLVIMGAMALGFYASTITSVQTSKNQRDNEEGLLAAESGMQFMKYCLSHVSVPSGTTTDG